MSDSAADLGSVGPYRLIRQLGRGGMGTVYLGDRSDDAFQKLVAIKVLKRGMDSEAIVRRFRHERQILAGLNHPYIAVLLDGGTTAEGLPYFAMEYVEGRPIVEYCESERLETTARLELFRKVCSAVQYAHQSLIVHRDIKPANVLVARDGTPKLLDFGIAKLLSTEADAIQGQAQTVGGVQLMTPEYASPEQVRGDVVTTATDVYSLGVLLYELLTGRRPYRLTSRSPAAIARVVCESVPDRPSTAVTKSPNRTDFDDVATGADLNETPTRITQAARPELSEHADRLRKRLAGDLDNIVLKALSKDPARRYASVEQFGEDVRRHLVGLPVIARKETLGYLAVKFVGRNKVATVAAFGIFLALVAGIIGTTWQARTARAERARAEQRFDDVRRLANSLLFELHDQIRDLPGSTPARQLLVTKALEYLDKLSRDAGPATDLRRELAAAYVKVGDVQGRPLTPNLGDTAGAMASYKKAVSLYESIGNVPASPASTPGLLAREQGTAYMRVAEMLSVMGNAREALSFAERGLALQKRGDSSSSSADLRRELAASHSRVGDLLATTGDLTKALQERRTALSLMESLTASAPSDAANLRQLGIAFQKLGNTLGNPNAPNIGDYQGALAAFDRAADVFRRGTAAHPSITPLRRNLAVVDSNTSDVLVALKRPADARARMAQALATFRDLAKADPTNAAAQNDVAIAQSKLGELLDGQGHSAEALREYRQALVIHENLARADPANDALKGEVASGQNRVATVQAKLGDRAGSLAHHARAVAISRELSDGNRDNVELRVALALALTGRGDAYALFARREPLANQRTDLTAAIGDYTEGVALLEALRTENAIAGSDLQTLNAAKAELASLTKALGAPR